MFAKIRSFASLFRFSLSLFSFARPLNLREAGFCRATDYIVSPPIFKSQASTSRIDGTDVARASVCGSVCAIGGIKVAKRPNHDRCDRAVRSAQITPASSSLSV